MAAALRRTGATAVLVTHDQAEALSMGDGVAVLRDGVLVQVAAPETLYRRPADIALARFLGEAVVLPGEAAAAAVRCLLGALFAGRTLRGGRGGGADPPEQIRLAAPGVGHPAAVEAVTYYGHDCSVALSAAGLDGRLTALVPGYASPVDRRRRVVAGRGAGRRLSDGRLRRGLDGLPAFRGEGVQDFVLAAHADQPVALGHQHRHPGRLPQLDDGFHRRLAADGGATAGRRRRAFHF